VRPPLRQDARRKGQSPILAARRSALLCGRRRNGRGGLWFVPLDVLMPSVRFLCAFAPQTAPAVKVPSLTRRTWFRVSVPARWLLNGGETSFVCVSVPPGRHVWRPAESSLKRCLFPAAQD